MSYRNITLSDSEREELKQIGNGSMQKGGTALAEQVISKLAEKMKDEQK